MEFILIVWLHILLVLYISSSFLKLISFMHEHFTTIYFDIKSMFKLLFMIRVVGVYEQTIFITQFSLYLNSCSEFAHEFFITFTALLQIFSSGGERNVTVIDTFQ